MPVAYDHTKLFIAVHEISTWIIKIVPKIGILCLFCLFLPLKYETFTQDAHWIDLGVSQSDDVSAEIADVSETERKRREAVWELFRSECVFLIDHLMVLKHVSLSPGSRVILAVGLKLYAHGK